MTGHIWELRIDAVIPTNEKLQKKERETIIKEVQGHLDGLMLNFSRAVNAAILGYAKELTDEPIFSIREVN